MEDVFWELGDFEGLSGFGSAFLVGVLVFDVLFDLHEELGAGVVELEVKDVFERLVIHHFAA